MDCPGRGKFVSVHCWSMRDQVGRPATGKTPHRTVRVPDGIWHLAQVITAGREETITDVVVRGLHDYVKRHGAGVVIYWVRPTEGDGAPAGSADALPPGQYMTAVTDHPLPAGSPYAGQHLEAR